MAYALLCKRRGSMNSHTIPQRHQTFKLTRPSPFRIRTSVIRWPVWLQKGPQLMFSHLLANGGN